MTDRQAKLEEFLRDAGWHMAAREPLLGDASARRYTRLVSRGGSERAMLMDAPPGKGLKTRAFIDIGRWLFEGGFSAPEIIKADDKNGFVLLEDLGDALFSNVCTRTPDQEQNLYAHAVDVLKAVGDMAPPADVAPYTIETYLAESRLLVDWYLPAASGSCVSDGLCQTFDGLIEAACGTLTNDHKCLVLRDYHADNLIWLHDRNPLRRVGLLDFQDGLSGHPAYDLVSLLEDARRDVDEGLRPAMLDRFLSTNRTNREVFMRDYACLGAQRNLKIIGIFTRLCVRDAKPVYVDMIPRVWQHLQRDLSHPALTALRAFVNRHIPEPDAAVLARIRTGAT